MRLRIHRGASEIGGNCVELEVQGRSILLDLGLPLAADSADPSLLPAGLGLADGSNPDLLGIVLSHTHGDHDGLAGLVHGSIPVFMGNHSAILQRARQPFIRNIPQPGTIKTYTKQIPFDLGPFRVTPFLIDHSGFDAYSLLVEADGKRVFYTGDFRAHGRKARLVEELIQKPPSSIDVLLLEGTRLSRIDDGSVPETEQDLEERIFRIVHAAPGLVLASFSPQNIDRFVTIFRAARRAGRTFVADVYLAHVLAELNLQSLPEPCGGAIRVYLPAAQRRRIVSDLAFDLVKPFRKARIFSEELAADPNRFAMLFRSSMRRDIERLPPNTASTLIYSLWPGYLERNNDDLKPWCERQGIAFEIAHTSGHADAQTLARFASAIRARKVVPIHIETPQAMQSMMPNVQPVPNHSWFEV